MFSMKSKVYLIAFLLFPILIAFSLSSAAAQSMGLPDEGADLQALDVCALLPQSEVAAIIGNIREFKPLITIDREKGCQWVNKDGHFFEITYLPLDQWGLARITMNNPKPLDAGDGGFEARYSDALVIKVLAKGRVVIYVRVSDDSKKTALELYRLALKYLPEK